MSTTVNTHENDIETILNLLIFFTYALCENIRIGHRAYCNCN